MSKATKSYRTKKNRPRKDKDWCRDDLHNNGSIERHSETINAIENEIISRELGDI